MKRKIKITASVEVYVEISKDEDVTERTVDIYLHGNGPDGYLRKEDLGADEWKIELVR